MTRLTVVVPFYNVEAYAAQTLRSLQRSVAPGIEFLLVDDASTDSTGQILQQQAAHLDGAQVLSRARNGGLAAARNVGIDAARGEYIAFLDGDDFVAPGYYPTLLATIQHLGCDMLRTDHVRVTGRERKVHRINHGPRGVVSRPRDAILPAHRATSVDAPNAWAGIYHRRLADSGALHFTESFRTCEDRPWNWRLHLRAETFAVVGLAGVFYRRDVSTSLTRLVNASQFDFLRAFDQIVADVLADCDAEALLPKALWSYCAMICWHLNRSEHYPAELAATLTALCQLAVRRLPPAPLQDVLDQLDPRRAAIIAELRSAS